MTSLETALYLLDQGLAVIPVPRPRPGVPVGSPGDGKVPAIAWKDFQSRLPTEAEIRQWFSATPMNVAIITGAVSGVVAIDCDSLEALRWWTRQGRPYTPWQVRTPRGWHLYYAHPGGRVPNRARLETPDGRLAIDVRGDGGFVIAPGSLHASGAFYAEAGDWSASRDELPRFWPGWLQRPHRPTTPRPTTRPTGDLVARARRYLAAIPPPAIGAGSDSATLYAACRLVRGFGLASSDATALLWDWCGGRAGWTYDWVAQKVDHAERYGTELMGALQ